MPAKAPRSVAHDVQVPGAAKRILAAARSLERVAAVIDVTSYVACLAGDAVALFDALVVGGEVLVGQWPVDEARVSGYRSRPVALHGVGPALEVPGQQPPADIRRMNLGPVESIHHHQPTRALGGTSLFGRCSPHCRYLVVRLRRPKYVTALVLDLVRHILLTEMARPGLDSHDLQPGVGKQGRRQATRSTEANHHDISFRKGFAHRDRWRACTKNSMSSIDLISGSDGVSSC